MGAEGEAGDGDEPVAEPRDELRRLAAGFRTNLALRQRSGLIGVAAARTRRRTAVPHPPSAKMTAAVTAGPAPTPAPVRIGTLDGPDMDSDEDTPPQRPPGAMGLSLVREELGECTRCKLSTGRKKLVYGVGNPDAHLVFVGEAPGADEDEQGEPFVGKAGQLLNKMIEAMGYARQDVYICNVVKCRPPQNRNPEPDEIAACEPFLKKQLGAIRPRMIVTLGKFAAQCLLRDDTPISRLRGNFRTYEGIQLMPTFHPAYLLRDPSKKKEAWEDLKAVLAALRRLGFEPPGTPAT